MNGRSDGQTYPRHGHWPGFKMGVAYAFMLVGVCAKIYPVGFDEMMKK